MERVKSINRVLGGTVRHFHQTARLFFRNSSNSECKILILQNFSEILRIRSSGSCNAYWGIGGTFRCCIGSRGRFLPLLTVYVDLHCHLLCATPLLPTIARELEHLPVRLNWLEPRYHSFSNTLSRCWFELCPCLARRQHWCNLVRYFIIALGRAWPLNEVRHDTALSRGFHTHWNLEPWKCLIDQTK